MKKLSLAGFAVVSLVALGAFAERVGIAYSVTANGTNATATAISGAVAGNTNYAEVAYIVATVPAQTKADLIFYTHGSGVDAQTGETVRFNNSSSNAVAICGAPGMLSGNGVSVERYRIPVYGTNSLFKLIQYTAATNTWPIIIMFQQ